MMSAVSNVRCKFVCNSVTKRKGHDAANPLLYEAEFSVVYNGSPENEQFFKYTPSGQLKVGTYKEDHFEVGKEYFLDITPAPTAPRFS